jgi:Cu(I)/Ag(I) efflux system membrane fusion protein
VRLLGRIAPDEETLKNITAWIGGRIDRLYVNTTGQRVHAGQKVASLYSPEVYSAHQDLITAAAQVQRLQDGSESARRAAEAALSAARQRLSLLGVPGDEVARMQKQEKPTISISIHSPFSGTVMQRFATEGSYVTTGARLYSVADLASLWIELDAYEKDLPLLSVGQNVDVAVEAYPGETFVGRVTFIEPTLDQHLRTSKVRVQLDNKDRRLRPGMFGQAVVASEQGLDTAPLVIPASAPLFTGRRSIVYVEVPGQEGLVYDARTVRLGPRLGDSYPVVAGLTEGERVVVRGAFALDADLQIKGGRSMMMSPDDSESGTWDELIHVSRSKLRPLRETMEQYLAIQKALSADDLPAAKQGATELRASLSAVDLKQPVEVAQAWDHVQGMLSGGAQHIAQADSIEQARKGFEHLSGAVIMLLRTFGNPMDRSLTLAHCPMARGSEGANWVQEGTQIENSYFGEAMRTCGDIQAHIEPGGHLAPPGRTRGNSTPQPMEGHDH